MCIFDKLIKQRSATFPAINYVNLVDNFLLAKDLLWDTYAKDVETDKEEVTLKREYYWNVELVSNKIPVMNLSKTLDSLLNGNYMTYVVYGTKENVIYIPDSTHVIALLKSHSNIKRVHMVILDASKEFK